MKDNKNRTYVVTETCPHCEREVELHGWDTDQDGFKAFCPYCGQRLMLCDECRHCGGEDCDYNSATDTCRHNAGHVPFTKLCVKTSRGTLMATATTDPSHPGISIDICSGQDHCDVPLALIELDCGDIVSRIWGDAQSEDYTHKVVHARIAPAQSTELSADNDGQTPKSYAEAKAALKTELFMRGVGTIESILDYAIPDGESKDAIDSRLDFAIEQMDPGTFWRTCEEFGV